MTSGILAPLDLLEHEKDLWKRGYYSVCGLDEAGAGCVAGPLALACVILPSDAHLPGMRDGKKLSPKQREHYAQEIKNQAIAWSTAFAEATEIDRLGIASAWRRAANTAVGKLGVKPDFILIDGVRPLASNRLPQKVIVRGDSLSLSIMAAGILAKVARDSLMRDLDNQYPGYGFATHKGYLTLEHQLAIDRLGGCAIHRLSWAPFKKQLELFDLSSLVEDSEHAEFLLNPREGNGRGRHRKKPS